ncbi:MULTISPECIES: lysylphosphatidylglycerol synthase transmembrane domain-containing protein [unclassified Saccharopolyspora]|uniref:lysylphosphatidylglycerol synthase transmembrane domain-containing protein n=1 Tax=unclassified Saccharopolyspora TaxID=2646250 RepID=UPI001CD6DFA3|nr:MULTISPECIES: lysylphosphatidylglycerol synthase transmembrane domain-containing protein [unclassified Saccharopolyspora]MCA1193402.1 flippase-like domain-containing protein [Saccharopolyspora sp. 6V]MCA1280635.1 flippase-like domain-containing protein [Saccharopolyspora sp. 7B]
MPSRRLRVAAALLVVAAVAALVWANRHELPAAGRALRDADPRWLAVGAGVLLVWIANWVLLHVAARRVTGAGGYHEFAGLLPVTVASIALNLAVKSGNVAGVAAFSLHARGRGTGDQGRVTGAYLAAAQTAEVGFVVTLAAGLAVVCWDGRLERAEVVATVLFSAGLLARVVALVAAVRSREVLRRVWAWPGRLLDRVLRREPRARDTEAADDFYAAVAAIRARPWTALPAVCFAVLIDVLGAAVLWASMVAVGAGDRPLVALVAYAVSTLFGIVGVLPGGVGFVEVGAAAALASYGIPVGVSAAAVLVFRVFVFWLPLALGGVLAWRLRSSPG